MHHERNVQARPAIANHINAVVQIVLCPEGHRTALAAAATPNHHILNQHLRHLGVRKREDQGVVGRHAQRFRERLAALDGVGRVAVLAARVQAHRKQVPGLDDAVVLLYQVLQHLRRSKCARLLVLLSYVKDSMPRRCCR